MLLKDALLESYEDWKDDLSGPWKEVFESTELDYDSVNSNLVHLPWEPIFPSRKNKRILGEPRGASTFSAFSGISPNKVKVVIIGQDPYPNVAQATGRAFEQGDVGDLKEDGHMVTKSLRRILQVLADFRKGNTRYTRSVKGYERLMSDIENREIDIETRAGLFRKWVREGVLLLNAGLTISRFGGSDSAYQFEGHIPLWKPVISATLEYLAKRKSGHVVFVLWGRKAQNILEEADVEGIARAQGNWLTRVRVVTKTHPAADSQSNTSLTPFFLGKNILTEANEALEDMQTTGIDW